MIAILGAGKMGEALISGLLRAGRSPSDVVVVVRRSARAAQLRETYGVEAVSAADAVKGAEWHLIGHLQTNKTRVAAGRFALIQSVDSGHLADALARINVEQKVLVEVNVAREAQKTGVQPAEAGELISAVAEMLDLQGLMAMGPARGDPTPAFLELRTMRDEAQQRLGKALPILSMGMSDDFEAAVAAGSTMVRLGRILFGPRP